MRVLTSLMHTEDHALHNTPSLRYVQNTLTEAILPGYTDAMLTADVTERKDILEYSPYFSSESNARPSMTRRAPGTRSHTFFYLDYRTGQLPGV